MGYASGGRPYKEPPAAGMVADHAPVALSRLVGESDTVWEAAVRAAGAELLAAYEAYVADLAECKSLWRFANEGYAGDPGLARTRALMQLAKVDGYPPQIRRLHELAGDRPVRTVKVSQDYVLTLDREFQLVCTCRYGHLASHHITGHDATTVTRQCTECDPPTSWKEHR